MTRRKPARIDETVDLKNGYVIPPFGEGHNHWVEPQATEDDIRNYLRDGCEASFPVFDGNPLTDFDQIKNIKLRFKQRYLIETPRE